MRFNDNSNLDSSRVQDGGGSGGGGGGLGGGLGGGGIGLPHIAGGGVIGLIIAVVVLLAQNGMFGSAGQVIAGAGSAINGNRLSGGGLPASIQGASGAAQFDYSQCKTGKDANEHPECALVAVENSLTDYWKAQLGSRFKPESTVDVFHGSVNTGACGVASTDAGPFYCPASNHQGGIYLDPAFYDTIYKQIGGDATPFVQAYVLAHEYGHHIQDVLGLMANQDGSTGANSFSVHLELQADCFAGMWAAAAPSTKTADGGDPIVSEITQDDVSQAIEATHDVGDDHIQKTVGGGIDESQWTHGSSAQREAWFRAGMDAGNDLNKCSTFDAQDLNDPTSIR